MKISANRKPLFIFGKATSNTWYDQRSPKAAL